ncbi:hypothetical protein [Clostridium culturomicium]|uniref:hypothetical protein n=1 Tax=Clostridium culturomicium TaxID=1499683 RepID=UPI003857A68F
MDKNEVITYLTNIKKISIDEALNTDVLALSVAINAIVALDTIKKNLIQIEAPNVADSYIDDSLKVIEKVFTDCEN